MDRPVDDLEPVSTGVQSLFSDTTTYGRPIDRGIIMTVSSPDISTDKADSNGLVTGVEARPCVTIDLGEARVITGLSVERIGKGTLKGALVILHSSDSREWQESARTKETIAEIPLNGYKAGAWIPGCSARAIRIELDSHEPMSLALRHCVVYGK